MYSNDWKFSFFRRWSNIVIDHQTTPTRQPYSDIEIEFIYFYVIIGISVGDVQVLNLGQLHDFLCEFQVIDRYFNGNNYQGRWIFQWDNPTSLIDTSQFYLSWVQPTYYQLVSGDIFI